MVLQHGGFRTDIAYDAAQAKQLLAQHAYAGMTLDILLPDQHGIALLGDLRKEARTRSLPIVVVSIAAHESREVLNGDAIGVVDWLEKPIDTARLRAAVEQAVREHANGKARILHIEDDPDLVEVVTAMLREVAEVAVAGTLQEGHGKLEAEHFDLVILDVELPDGSGLDVLPLLKDGSHTPTPVIVFSAHAVGAEIAEQVSATLVKARTSNEKLLDTIASLTAWRDRRMDEARDP